MTALNTQPGTVARGLRRAFRPLAEGGRLTARARRRHALRPRLDALEERTLLSTVTWINPSGGDWDTPSNWSSGALPGPSDDVVINQPDITVTHNGGNDSVNSITSQDPITLNGGTLGVAAASTISGLLTLGFGGITLSGGGTVDAFGGITW